MLAASGRRKESRCRRQGRRIRPEFRAEAVRLARSSGLPLPELARELGVSPQSLRNWFGQAQIDAGEREGLSSEEREELRRLRRDNARA